jgi:predicted dehydrogenase
MKRKVRWGVIGAGGIALRRTIPEGILPASNAELVSVYSRNRKRCAEVATQFGSHAAHNLDELLAQDIDAVYIATPNDIHMEQTLAAAAAGKHVLCEKPLGISVFQAKRMLEFCKKAKVNLGTAFMMRFHTQHRAASELVHQGRLGRPVFARAQLSCWYPPLKKAWRQNSKTGGGGVLLDLAGHCLDLLEMFFGRVTSLQCFTNNTIHSYQTEDSAVVMARFENGAMASIDTFFCIPDDSSKNRLELYGSKGSILAEGTIGQDSRGKMVSYLENGTGGYDARQARSTTRGVSINPPLVNTYRAEIESFSEAILKRRDTAQSALAGLRSQVLIAACYKSAQTGKEQKTASITA